MAVQLTQPEPTRAPSDWAEARRQWRIQHGLYRDVYLAPFDNPLDAVIAAQRFLSPINPFNDQLGGIPQ